MDRKKGKGDPRPLRDGRMRRREKVRNAGNQFKTEKKSTKIDPKKTLKPAERSASVSSHKKESTAATELRRLVTTQGFWSEHHCRGTLSFNRSNLTRRILYKQFKRKKNLKTKSQEQPTYSGDDKKEVTENTKTSKVGKVISVSNLKTNKKSCKLSELKRLQTTDGFWSPSFTSLVSPSSSESLQSSSNDSGNKLPVLKRLKTTKGFWSPSIGPPSSNQPSRDGSPSSSTSSLDRITRRGTGKSDLVDNDKGSVCSEDERVIQSSKLVDGANSGRKSRAALPAINVKREKLVPSKAKSQVEKGEQRSLRNKSKEHDLVKKDLELSKRSYTSPRLQKKEGEIISLSQRDCSLRNKSKEQELVKIADTSRFHTSPRVLKKEDEILSPSVKDSNVQSKSKEHDSTLQNRNKGQELVKKDPESSSRFHASPKIQKKEETVSLSQKDSDQNSRGKEQAFKFQRKNKKCSSKSKVVQQQNSLKKEETIFQTETLKSQKSVRKRGDRGRTTIKDLQIDKECKKTDFEMEVGLSLSSSVQRKEKWPFTLSTLSPKKEVKSIKPLKFSNTSVLSRKRIRTRNQSDLQDAPRTKRSCSIPKIVSKSGIDNNSNNSSTECETILVSSTPSQKSESQSSDKSKQDSYNHLDKQNIKNSKKGAFSRKPKEVVDKDISLPKENVLVSELGISDLVKSGELKRLRTTDGFWSPPPNFSGIFSSSSHKLRQSKTKKCPPKSPTHHKSVLFQHCKKKLRSLKKAAVMTQTVSAMKQDESDPSKSPIFSQDDVMTLKKKFVLKRKRNKELFNNGDKVQDIPYQTTLESRSRGGIKTIDLTYQPNAESKVESKKAVSKMIASNMSQIQSTSVEKGIDTSVNNEIGPPNSSKIGNIFDIMNKSPELNLPEKLIDRSLSDLNEEHAQAPMDTGLSCETVVEAIAHNQKGEEIKYGEKLETLQENGTDVLKDSLTTEENKDNEFRKVEEIDIPERLEEIMCKETNEEVSTEKLGKTDMKKEADKSIDFDIEEELLNLENIEQTEDSKLVLSFGNVRMSAEDVDKTFPRISNLENGSENQAESIVHVDVLTASRCNSEENHTCHKTDNGAGFSETKLGFDSAEMIEVKVDTLVGCDDQIQANKALDEKMVCEKGDPKGDVNEENPDQGDNHSVMEIGVGDSAEKCIEDINSNVDSPYDKEVENNNMNKESDFLENKPIVDRCTDAETISTLPENVKVNEEMVYDNNSSLSTRVESLPIQEITTTTDVSTSMVEISKSDTQIIHSESRISKDDSTSTLEKVEETSSNDRDIEYQINDTLKYATDDLSNELDSGGVINLNETSYLENASGDVNEENYVSVVNTETDSISETNEMKTSDIDDSNNDVSGANLPNRSSDTVSQTTGTMFSDSISVEHKGKEKKDKRINVFVSGKDIDKSNEIESNDMLCNSEVCEVMPQTFPSSIVPDNGKTYSMRERPAEKTDNKKIKKTRKHWKALPRSPDRSPKCALRKVRKRRYNSWKKGVVKKYNQTKYKKKHIDTVYQKTPYEQGYKHDQSCSTHSSESSASLSGGCGDAENVAIVLGDQVKKNSVELVVNELASQDGKNPYGTHTIQPDTTSIGEAQQIQPDSKTKMNRFRSDKQMLKRLTTEANFGSAPIVDENKLLTRTKRGILPLKEMASHKAKPKCSNNSMRGRGRGRPKRPTSEPRIDSTISELSIKIPDNSSQGATSLPLPILKPLDFVTPVDQDNLMDGPPVLTPQFPLNFEESTKASFDEGLENDIVEEFVDDTNLHLYWSDDEKSPIKKGNPVKENLLSGSSEDFLNQKPLNSSAQTEVVRQPRKLKGKKGRPPGIKVTRKSPKTARKTMYQPKITELVSARTFEFRKKTTRSPLEMLEMKRRQEEAIYDMQEQQRRARLLLMREKRNARISPEEVLGVSSSDEDESLNHFDIKPCFVVLNDFVKKLKLEGMFVPGFEDTDIHSSPFNLDYDDDENDEDWYADLEDIEEEEDEYGVSNESGKRPHIPRLKLKRVIKKQNVKNLKSKNLVSQLKSPEEDPLKLVIKTEPEEPPTDVAEPVERHPNVTELPHFSKELPTLANVTEPVESHPNVTELPHFSKELTTLANVTAPVNQIDLSEVERTGFVGSYLDFLKERPPEGISTLKPRKFKLSKTNFPSEPSSSVESKTPKSHSASMNSSMTSKGKEPLKTKTAQPIMKFNVKTTTSTSAGLGKQMLALKRNKLKMSKNGMDQLSEKDTAFVISSSSIVTPVLHSVTDLTSNDTSTEENDVTTEAPFPLNETPTVPCRQNEAILAAPHTQNETTPTAPHSRNEAILAASHAQNEMIPAALHIQIESIPGEKCTQNETIPAPYETVSDSIETEKKEEIDSSNIVDNGAKQDAVVSIIEEVCEETSEAEQTATDNKQLEVEKSRSGSDDKTSDVSVLKNMLNKNEEEQQHLEVNDNVGDCGSLELNIREEQIHESTSDTSVNSDVNDSPKLKHIETPVIIGAELCNEKMNESPNLSTTKDTNNQQTKIKSNNNNEDKSSFSIDMDLSNKTNSPVHSTSDESSPVANESSRLKIIMPQDRLPSSFRYTCKRCDFFTFTKLTIESHIYSHIPGVQFQCATCQTEFSSMAAAASHLKNIHLLNNQKLHITGYVDEANFYDKAEVPGDQENNPISVTSSQINPTGSGGQSPPVIISVVVSGGAGNRAVRTGSTNRRYVCSHCGFSTNVREDIEQHISDLHPSEGLFSCKLCNESVYSSENDIKQHCTSVHPSRPKPYRKLPDFYDTDHMAKMEKQQADQEEHGSSIYRVSSVDSSSVDHKLKAKEYLDLQEDWKGKKSAEADSTTAVDFSEVAGSKEQIDLSVSSDTDAIEDLSVKTTPASFPPSCTTTEEKIPREKPALSNSEDLLGFESNNTQCKGDEDAESDSMNMKIVEVVSLSEQHTDETQDSCDDKASSSLEESVKESPDTAIPTSDSSISAINSSSSDISQLSTATTGTAINSSSSVVDCSTSLVSSPKHAQSLSPTSLEENSKESQQSIQQHAPFLNTASSTSVVPPMHTLKSSHKESEDTSALPVETSSVTDISGPTLLPSSTTKSDFLHENLNSSPIASAPSTPTPSTSSVSSGLPLSYKCKACKVHTPYLLMMVKHLKSRHPTIRCFSCPYCKSNSSFISQKQLRHHVRSQHPTMVDKNEISLSKEANKLVEAMVLPNSSQCTRVGNRLVLEEDIHTCTLCSLRMTSMPNVYDHLKEKHSDLFEFVCPVCQAYKNKSLQDISYHCTSQHGSKLDKDKFHVSVPKYLFVVLKCISANGKYIEKSLTPESSSASKTTSTIVKTTTPTSSSASTTVASTITTSSQQISHSSLQQIMTTGNNTSQTSAISSNVPKGITHSSFIGANLSSQDQRVSLALALPTPRGTIISPLVAVPLRPVLGANTNQRPVNISSALFDTSSLVAVAVSTTSSASSDNNNLTLNATKLPRPSTSKSPRTSGLPVLNIPTVGKQRSEPSPYQQQSPVMASSQEKTASSQVKMMTCNIQSTTQSDLSASSAMEQLPENEPNPDAFKIFNLRPSLPTASSIPPQPPLSAAGPASVVPSVFPPVSSSLALGFIPGPIAGFPAAMVIPPNLVHNAFPFAARSANPGSSNTWTPPATAVVGSNRFYRPTISNSNQQPPSGYYHRPSVSSMVQKNSMIGQQQQSQGPSQQISHLNSQAAHQHLRHSSPSPIGNIPTVATNFMPHNLLITQKPRLPPPPNVLPVEHLQRPYSRDANWQFQVRQQFSSSTSDFQSQPQQEPMQSTSSSLAASGSGVVAQPSKKGKRGSQMYQCPYCTHFVELRALDVATHIQQFHPGKPVAFRKAP